jgi:hypothetical protein
MGKVIVHVHKTKDAMYPANIEAQYNKIARALQNAQDACANFSSPKYPELEVLAKTVGDHVDRVVNGSLTRMKKQIN